jgi:Uma2 family endonuclease
MATTAISIDDYLKKIPDPDVEYIDGQLRERPVVLSVHGLLQSEICIWCGAHRKDWKVRSAVEVRTQVSPTHVFLPDVVIDHARKWPPVLTQPPLIVIEILSPGDSFMELEQKCVEYWEMGIRNVWVINPQRRTGRVWHEGAWIESKRFAVDVRDLSGSGVALRRTGQRRSRRLVYFGWPCPLRASAGH